MRRILRKAAFLCLIATVAVLVVFWVRSYRHADRIHGRIWGSESFVIASKQGRLTVVTFRDPEDGTMRSWAPWRWGVYSCPANQESFPLGDLRDVDTVLGFGILDRPVVLVPFTPQEPAESGSVEYVEEQDLIVTMGSDVIFLNGTGLILPYWFLAFVAIAMAIAVQMSFRWRFGLRGMLIAITCIALLMGMAAVLERMPIPNPSFRQLDVKLLEKLHEAR